MTARLFEPLFATARHSPERTALVDRAGRIDYAGLAEKVDRFAAALQASGVAPGDRVAVLLPNVSEAVIAMYGTLRAGAVFMPVNPLIRADKLTRLLADARARFLVASASLAAAWIPAVANAADVEQVVSVGDGVLPAPVRAPVTTWLDWLAVGEAPVRDPGGGDDDLAALVYTSGSTGDAKGVMLTHRNMLTVGSAVQSYLGLEARDVLYCALPLSFSYGICQLTAGLPVGATIVLDTSFAFPAKSVALMAAERVTCFAGVPTMYTLLLALPNLAEFDLGALRICTNAADALPDPVLARLRRALPEARIFCMYGLTECQRVTYLHPDELDRRPGSVGRGMPHQELWLVNSRGERLPNGATGELVVRGPHVMKGYWEKPKETDERLRPGPLPGERVLYTGDIFRTDEDGFLYFVSRKDDLIKSRGEKVSPREVENAIHALPGVAAVAVVGTPDPVLGQAIRAFVVAEPGASITDRDVIRYCKERLESYMVPRDVTFVDELPWDPLESTCRHASLSIL